MTRAEHYCAGKAEGERWAEDDLRNAPERAHEMILALRQDGALARYYRNLGPTMGSEAAFALGRARGYRQVAG